MQISRCPTASLQRAAAPRQLAPLAGRSLRVACRAEDPSKASSTATEQQQEQSNTPSLDQQLTKLTRQTAGTFAPRASGSTGKNPAVKGSVLYNVFEVQAWVALLAGGLLSFNVIFPTDEPSIARLMGMWSIWMFTIPSLRAKECAPREKDALNLLFLLVPLINVALPFVWKSFPFIFAADVAAVVSVYAVKGVWSEVYGIPLGLAVEPAAAAAAAGSGSSSEEQQDTQQ
uniref:Uncharacterized protein n=1 Tax=Tetradesmus obliquus TaxID=3088 RepID=A0A383VPR9_TETOB|eukprot:jgi/Sobl393_1/16556/SZX66426.1